MPIKIFYNLNQSVPNNQSFSPSAGKPTLVVDQFKTKFQEKVEVFSDFLPLTREQIKLAHDSNFVDNILDCKIENGFNNKQQDIANSLLWTNGSFYAAAQYALDNNTVTMSPTSGFHHAGYNTAEGFCTFNGLMIAALLLKHHSNIKHVAIIDFDAHYGNGTDNIINKLNIDWITNYTFGRFADELVNTKAGFDNWLNNLENYNLESTIEDCDIVLYQAGADPHINDPYGGYLTTEQMRRRDEIVFKTTRKLNKPIVWNLAGGYQKPIQLVLDLHSNTMKECLKVYNFNNV